MLYKTNNVSGFTSIVVIMSPLQWLALRDGEGRRFDPCVNHFCAVNRIEMGFLFKYLPHYDTP